MKQLQGRKGMSQISACCLLLVGFSLDLHFDPDDGGSTFLRHLSEYLANYKAYYMR
jgi:hypothetical protein